MTKTILADVSGFTPVIDRMAMEHGLIYAAVFGRMWRFCQMEDGVCKASLDKIASGLHIDKATVMRYANRLVEDGYLKDLTPDLRNVPHVYADTGKASIRVGIGVTVAGCNADTEQDETVAGCNATVEQGNAYVADGNATVAQSKLKIVSKIDHKKDAEDGISHPDFDRACAILESIYPADILSAGPVLLEADEKPYRLRIRLNAMPPDFMQHLTDALQEANPRRHYRLSFETPGTGRAVQDEATAQVEDPAIDTYAPTDENLLTWQSIVSELSFDAQPNTRRAYIDPARPISVNGNWTIAVPSVEWWQSLMYPSLKRVYKKITGETTDFIFVELNK